MISRSHRKWYHFVLKSDTTVISLEIESDFTLCRTVLAQVYHLEMERKWNQSDFTSDITLYRKEISQWYRFHIGCDHFSVQRDTTVISLANGKWFHFVRKSCGTAIALGKWYHFVIKSDITVISLSDWKWYHFVLDSYITVISLSNRKLYHCVLKSDITVISLWSQKWLHFVEPF